MPTLRNLTDDEATNLVTNLSSEELKNFNYLFSLQDNRLYRANGGQGIALYSFENLFQGKLATLFKSVWNTIIKNITGSIFATANTIKNNSYYFMFVTHCILTLLDKKENYIVKGPIYDWSFGAIGNKYEKLFVALADSKNNLATINIIFWNDAKTKLKHLVYDYIKVRIYLPIYLGNIDNILDAKLKVLISRDTGNSQKQKTIQTTIRTLWKDLIAYIDTPDFTNTTL